jgi:hypothetical protein
MAELYRIPRTSSTDALLDVVFVHGLGGDKLTTWQATPQAESFWPSWLARDIPEVAVYSLGYDASPSAWLGHAMPLADRATNVLATLEAEQFGKRPLIFVCHSLGGLVVKQLLRTAATFAVESWQKLVNRVIGVIFLATPHSGSHLATYIGQLGRILKQTAALEDLRANDSNLRELSQWYSNNALGSKIDTRVYFETRDTSGVRVVDESSANPGISGVVPIPIDADHLSLCKPADCEALVYKSVRQFVADCVKERQTAAATAAGSVAAVSSGAHRFFISYRRRADADARLARLLSERLRAAGNEVFIDVDMPVGVEWSTEIDRRISWAQYLIVLLSEESSRSEMVQSEIRRGRGKQEAGQNLTIFPVRVAYTGPLPYELDAYLSRLQYVLWEGEQDDDKVLAAIQRAVALKKGLPAEDNPITQPRRVVTNMERPEPRADMRVLRESLQLLESPGSPLSPDNPFYVSRDADVRVMESAANGKPRTLVIKGPNQMGKSSLLRRYLARCLQTSQQIALVDLMIFGAVNQLTFEQFALQFAHTLLDELDIRGVVPPVMRRALELTHFLQDTILPRVSGTLVVAIDEADRAIGSPWQEDFYGALRGWHSHRQDWRKQATWGRLGLALVIATDPNLLIESGYTSPFNVVSPISLRPFARDALDAFNRSYNEVLDSRQLDRLYALLGGHPYLTPLAFYRLIYEELDFQAMVADAHKESGPFGDHLRSKLDRLNGAKLLPAMRSVVYDRRIPNADRMLFYRLEAIGLVVAQELQINASNELYERFFRAVL